MDGRSSSIIVHPPVVGSISERILPQGQRRQAIQRKSILDGINVSYKNERKKQQLQKQIS